MKNTVRTIAMSAALSGMVFAVPAAAFGLFGGSDDDEIPATPSTTRRRMPRPRHSPGRTS